MVHSKNYKRLQHNSCRISYRNIKSRANQGRKFNTKHLRKLATLSKRQQRVVMITRLMYTKPLRNDRQIEYNVLQKIKDQIRNNKMHLLDLVVALAVCNAVKTFPLFYH